MYKYTYDKNGNILDVYIGGKTDGSGAYTGGDLYAKYTYADDGTLSYVKYGNDQTVSYEYNSFGQVTKQKYKASSDAQEKVQYEYIYTENAQDEESSVLKEKYDYEAMQKTVYDESGKVSIYCLDKRMIFYESDESDTFYYSYYETDETTNEQGEKVPGKIEYDCLLNDISITKNENGYSLVVDYKNTHLNYTSQLKDGRLSTESVKKTDGNAILETSYTYNEKGFAESIISKSLDGTEIVTSYKYDDKGRITEYTCDGKTVYYTYDSKGQLIREDGHGKTRVYTYDKRGNFKSTREYEYTRGEIDTNPVYTEYFEVKYNDTAWLDKITGVDDDEMIYDLMGNLVSLADCTIKWTNGRQMSEVVSNETGETVLELLYDDNGILTQKTDYEGTTYYTNIDGNFTTQYLESKTGIPTEQMQFIYDDNN